MAEFNLDRETGVQSKFVSCVHRAVTEGQLGPGETLEYCSNVAYSGGAASNAQPLGPGGVQPHLLGPGGVQHLLGPGGVQPHLLGPGGVQHLLGPGGVQLPKSGNALIGPGGVAHTGKATLFTGGVQHSGTSVLSPEGTQYSSSLLGPGGVQSSCTSGGGLYSETLYGLDRPNPYVLGAYGRLPAVRGANGIQRTITNTQQIDGQFARQRIYGRGGILHNFNTSLESGEGCGW